MNIYNFKKDKPKRGSIICFNDHGADYYKIDYKGGVWGLSFYGCEYCCKLEDLQSYGNYTHWARLGNFPFNIRFDIPEE